MAEPIPATSLILDPDEAAARIAEAGFGITRQDGVTAPQFLKTLSKCHPGVVRSIRGAAWIALDYAVTRFQSADPTWAVEGGEEPNKPDTYEH